MSEEITNTQNIIDSRNVIERIEELRKNIIDDQDNTLDCEREELKILSVLAEEGEAATPDWPHGTTLIHEYYFQEYAQEFAKDIEAISSDAYWPHRYIDWERAADELKMDYAAIDFDGVTYYVR